MENKIQSSYNYTEYTKNKNVSTYEQTIPTKETSVRNFTTQNKTMVTLGASDSAWDLEELCSKDYYLKTFSWTSSQIISDTIGEIIAWQDIISSVENLKILFYMMTYIRSGIRFRIKVNGTKFHQGQSIWSMIPTVNSIPIKYINEPNLVSSLPHVLINPNTSETLFFDIPFASVYSNYSRFDPEAAIGVLVGTVLNPLTLVGSSSASINITLSFSFIDPSLHVPIFNTAVPLEQTYTPHGGIGDAISSVVGAAGVAMDIADGNWISAIDNAPRVFEKTVSAVNKIKNSDYDQPNSEQMPSTFIRNTMPPIAIGSGPDVSREMSINPLNTHFVPEGYCGDTSTQLSLLDLARKPSYLFSIPWSIAQPSGTVLAEFPVYPGQFVTRGNNRITPSWIAYISNLFSLWGGSIKFKLETIISQFQEASLVIAFIPNQYVDVSEVTLTQAMQGAYLLWDVKEAHSIFYEAPMNVSSAYLNNPVLEYAEEDLSNSSSYNICSGYIKIFVMNELVTTNSTASSALINVWVSAGSDFRLKCLRNPYKDNTADVNLNTYTPHVGEIGEDSVNIPATVIADLEPERAEKDGSALADEKVSFVGLDYDIVTQCRRRVLLVNKEFSATGTSRNFRIVLPITPAIENNTGYLDAVKETKAFKTILGYLARSFACWSGKLKYDIVITAPPDLQVECIPIYYQDKYDNYSEGPLSGVAYLKDSAYASDLIVANTQSSLSISVPWSQPYPVCFTNYSFATTNMFGIGYKGSTLNNGTLHLSFLSSLSAVQQTTVSFHVKIYVSAGEGFQFHYPTSPPALWNIPNEME